MLIQRLLQLLLVTIVVMAALAILGVVLKVSMALVKLAGPVLILLVVAAAVLRFVEIWKRKREER